MKTFPRRILLIVNADDFGISDSANTAIRLAHTDGIVTTTGVLMTMPEIEKDLKSLQDECPHLGLGIQLSLTAGEPLLPVPQRASLTGGERGFLSLAHLKKQCTSIVFTELLDEWRAQIDRFVAITGEKPQHLVAHEHCAYLSPQIFQALLALASEYDCCVRVPFTHSPTTRLGDLPFPLTCDMLRHGPNLLKHYQVRCTDRFTYLGLDVPPIQTLSGLLKRLPPGSTEIFCRPKWIDPSQPTGVEHPQGYEEFLALIAPQMREIIQKRGIELASFDRIETAPHWRAINTEQLA